MRVLGVQAEAKHVLLFLWDPQAQRSFIVRVDQSMLGGPFPLWVCMDTSNSRYTQTAHAKRQVASLFLTGVFPRAKEFVSTGVVGQLDGMSTCVFAVHDLGEWLECVRAVGRLRQPRLRVRHVTCSLALHSGSAAEEIAAWTLRALGLLDKTVSRFTLDVRVKGLDPDVLGPQEIPPSSFMGPAWDVHPRVIDLPWKTFSPATVFQDIQRFPVLVIDNPEHSPLVSQWRDLIPFLFHPDTDLIYGDLDHFQLRAWGDMTVMTITCATVPKPSRDISRVMAIGLGMLESPMLWFSDTWGVADPTGRNRQVAGALAELLGEEGPSPDTMKAILERTTDSKFVGGFITAPVVHGFKKTDGRPTKPSPATVTQLAVVDINGAYPWAIEWFGLCARRADTHGLMTRPGHPGVLPGFQSYLRRWRAEAEKQDPTEARWVKLHSNKTFGISPPIVGSAITAAVAVVIGTVARVARETFDALLGALGVRWSVHPVFFATDSTALAIPPGCSSLALQADLGQLADRLEASSPGLPWREAVSALEKYRSVSPVGFLTGVATLVTEHAVQGIMSGTRGLFGATPPLEAPPLTLSGELYENVRFVHRKHSSELRANVYFGTRVFRRKAGVVITEQKMATVGNPFARAAGRKFGAVGPSRVETVLVNEACEACARGEDPLRAVAEWCEGRIKAPGSFDLGDFASPTRGQNAGLLVLPFEWKDGSMFWRSTEGMTATHRRYVSWEFVAQNAVETLGMWIEGEAEQCIRPIRALCDRFKEKNEKQ